jgi:phenylalanyl-tRNA synthetase alpha chain
LFHTAAQNPDEQAGFVLVCRYYTHLQERNGPYMNELSMISTDPVLKEIFSRLEQIQGETLNQIEQAQSVDELEALRVTVLGRKGSITLISRGLKDIPNEDRPKVGAASNTVQQFLSQKIEARQSFLQHVALQERIKGETLDITLPGRPLPRGKQHPLTMVMEDIASIFRSMGFEVMEDHQCPEVETEYYNFDALNFPPDHPAKDMQDTFYTDVAPNVLLRSQTSNAQIRWMEKNRLPVRVLAPGRVYRNEEVTSRKFVLFHQIEGLLVDEEVTFAQLKGVLNAFITAFFGEERPTRFRASYFPFTEPSAEIDVQCILCHGKGCKTCSHSGWLEILGAGMVDPNVLQGVGIDPERYSGFAFGMGVERLAMLKYRIDDIRAFYTNDLRFLSQIG